MFTTALVQRYAGHFDQVRILPLEGGVVEHFFCDIVRAESTCRHLQLHPAVPANKSPPAHTNCKGGVAKECVDEAVRAMLLEVTLRTAAQTSGVLYGSNFREGGANGARFNNETLLRDQHAAANWCFCPR